MAILKVAKLGDPILRQVANPLTPDEVLKPAYQRFIDDLIDTMRKLDGVGLAAPQLFESRRVIAVESEDNPRYPGSPKIPLLVLVNPEFTFISEEREMGWEGCLSVENLRGMVPRSVRVSVKGYDRNFAPVAFDAAGFYARVLQHEIDHLNGKVYLDRMTDFSTLTHLAEFERYWMREPVPAS